MEYKDTNPLGENSFFLFCKKKKKKEKKEKDIETLRLLDKLKKLIENQVLQGK